MTLAESLDHALATIQTTDDIVAASRRLALTSRRRVEENAEQLRARCVAIGLLDGGVVYARGRRPPITGGASSENDENDLVVRRRLDTMRLKIKRQQLPRLAARHAWYSDGSGLP